MCNGFVYPLLITHYASRITLNSGEDSTVPYLVEGKE